MKKLCRYMVAFTTGGRPNAAPEKKKAASPWRLSPDNLGSVEDYSLSMTMTTAREVLPKRLLPSFDVTPAFSSERFMRASGEFTSF